MDDNIFLKLRETMTSYALLSNDTWDKIENMTTIKRFKKGDTLLCLGDVATELYFINQGLLRTYFSDIDGNIYNKNLFLENSFAGSKVSLLQNKPSEFAIEALEV